MLQALEDSLTPVTGTDKPELYLTTISGGSVTLTFPSSPALAATVKVVSACIRNANISILPEKARRGIIRLSKWTRRTKNSIEWLWNDNQTALITPELEISFEQAPVISGRTTIIGTIQTVGGERPSFRLRSSNGSLIICSCTASVAQDCGKLLYRKVRVTGMATNNICTAEIQEFTATEVRSAESKSSEAFAMLRKQFGNQFNPVDPDRFKTESANRQG